tara:strand:+ start:315 stop:1625 length:1311 start_codon:yes stop_codon:yes gene_type:complete
MMNKYISNYFFLLFAFIPISLILGSSVSLFNILLIDISFLFLLIYLKDFSFLKNKSFQYLIVLYIYLIFNTLISVDQEIGLARNLGFIRIIILFVAINYFFQNEKLFKKIFYVWLSIIFVVLLDVLLESFTGKNIFGYGSEYGRRVLSFFKDEPIVGGYLNAFYLILIGFLHLKFGEKYKNLVLFFSILILFSILLTGERSNLIKAILGIFLFYLLFREYQIKHKLYLMLGGLLIFISIIFSSDFLKLRYFYQIKSLVLDNKIYFKHYDSAFNIFKENKFFGVGNKNYRVVACSKFKEEADIINTEFGEPSDVLGSHGSKADKLVAEIEYVCTTHPHQVFFELLSEHGIFGSVIILYLIYKLVFSKLIFNLKELNYIQLGSGIYIILTFLPLIPSGSFFSDYLLTLFSLNLGIFYATNKNFNIFFNSQNSKLDINS